MDYSEKSPVQNPEENASLISKYLFLWETPLFKKGAKKDLEIDDVFDRLQEDDAGSLARKLETLWDNERQQAKLHGRQPSLRRTFAKFFGCSFLVCSFFVAFNEIVLRLCQPFLIRAAVDAFSDRESGNEKIFPWLPISRKYSLAFGIIVVNLFYVLNIHQIYKWLQHIAMKGRIAVSSVIYRKLLRLSKNVQSEHASMGKLVSLVGSDANRFDHCFFHFNMLFVGPLQILVLGYFLWKDLGVSCLAGIGIIVGFLLPFQYVVGRFSAKFRLQVAKRTDERGRVMNEIILGIRIIKMYAWEFPFGRLIHKLRTSEINPVKKAAYLRATFQSLNSLGKMTIPFCSFILFVSLGNELFPETAYFAILAYSIIITAMAQRMPVAAAQTGELIVALQRIQEFLLLDEIASKGIQDAKEQQLIIQEKPVGTITTPSISFQGVTAKWTNEKIVLRDISCLLEGDKLVMIVGPVGCGKTSLLSLLIQELPLSKGKMKVSGEMAYASQEAWIFPGTVRQNILFGSLYDEILYRNVVHVCALQEDFSQLPYGEETIVGEKGVALSGGQKARINLARAIYKKANIYLLDDPLSAVDSKVSKHIFQKCVKEQLRGSLRILVTHQIQYLPQADVIIVLNEEGRIQEIGSYEEIFQKNLEFLGTLTSLNKLPCQEKTARDSFHSSVENLSSNVHYDKKDANGAQFEKMDSGAVKWKSYLNYFASGRSKLELLLTFSLFIFAHAVVSFTDKWLSLWTNEVSQRSRRLHLNSTNTSEYLDESGSDNNYITIYTACVISAIFLITIKSFLFFHYCMTVSVNLHDKMFQGVVRAPVKFFDDNPSGRILNRFTRDLNVIDEQLPMCFNDFLNISLMILGSMSVVISTNYFLAAPSILLIFSLWTIRYFYVKTSRDLQRLQAITKSPVFLHIAATVQGLTTIRGLRTQEKVIDQFDALLDINTSPVYMIMTGNRFMGVWMDLTCILFFACVTIGLIISDSENAGDVGVSLTLTIAMLTSVQWGMRQSAEVENHMTSMQRIQEYSSIKSEANLETTEKFRDRIKSWPNKGSIQFKNVTLCYDEDQKIPVLKNLSFTISEREKIGIVGRTGAGKSSIVQALFRLSETQGEIFIDNMSIKDVGLHQLRKSISIIPQDPVLFSGTMRYNLDPFKQFLDHDLWRVLKEVNLLEVVPSLDFHVSDGGGNFSVGQRQLVCLARALLRQNKIIVLDEATANVDPNTDALIQQEVRSKFSDCTILTIAHRLNTVIDNDRIMVLDNGMLVDFDTPENLKQKDGLFSQMLSHCGPVDNQSNQ